jgi:argininosuccinate lyase
MMQLMISNIQVKENILDNEQYKYIFSVEEVNKLVLQGIPFRDAYKKVGVAIEEGSFNYSTTVNHTHEGSIGNLGTARIKRMMDEAISSFNFDKYHVAINALVK